MTPPTASHTDSYAVRGGSPLNTLDEESGPPVLAQTILPERRGGASFGFRFRFATRSSGDPAAPVEPLVDPRLQAPAPIAAPPTPPPPAAPPVIDHLGEQIERLVAHAPTAAARAEADRLAEQTRAEIAVTKAERKSFWRRSRDKDHREQTLAQADALADQADRANARPGGWEETPGWNE